jgi:hypothetical protein
MVPMTKMVHLHTDFLDIGIKKINFFGVLSDPTAKVVVVIVRTVPHRLVVQLREHVLDI